MANSANVFAAASGHNQTALQRFVPQPYCDGIRYPGEVFTPTQVYDDGEAFVVLRFNAPDPIQLAQIYSALGLTAAKAANVTVSLPTDATRAVWADYNGQAIKPPITPWEILRYGWIDIVVRQLEAV